ncbi:unnamed protein product, partial [Discosporangium mesarthrocarpum]
MSGAQSPAASPGRRRRSLEAFGLRDSDVDQEVAVSPSVSETDSDEGSISSAPRSSGMVSPPAGGQLEEDGRPRKRNIFLRRSSKRIEVADSGAEVRRRGLFRRRRSHNNGLTNARYSTG